ncbi:hypothetical protein C2I36_14730 [Rhodobacteraceae bacterium WD3A24]|nr:hypothetical protein C2I36_14730 [Rhodobacteraceae bacterium WD3A24]
MSSMKQSFWNPEPEEALTRCRAVWQHRGFLPLRDIYEAAAEIAEDNEIETVARRLMLAFDGARPVQAQIDRAARSGNREAEQLGALLRQRGLSHHPCWTISRRRARELEGKLAADPESYLTGLGTTLPYPAVMDDECLAFEGDWARQALDRSLDRLNRFIAARRSDTAILVGNGPSLAKVDLDLLEGQDVYISNYAIRDARLHRLARGVAVSNRFVARQEPHLFQTTPLWKFHPLWLGDVLRDTPETVYLNALGGELFFSQDVTTRIAWHSTVTFFWLQILYAAGYRKVCLIGVDNSYHQQPGAREGDLIEQTALDYNHFDPEYFRGKVWQAADTDRMAKTYRLARSHFEADGREIVNCTIGGNLEVFRRAALSGELSASIAPPIEPDDGARAQNNAAARRDVVRQTAEILLSRARCEGTPAGYALLKSDDPARALHERVQAFVKSLEPPQ